MKRKLVKSLSVWTTPTRTKTFDKGLEIKVINFKMKHGFVFSDIELSFNSTTQVHEVSTGHFLTNAEEKKLSQIINIIGTPSLSTDKFEECLSMTKNQLKEKFIGAIEGEKFGV